MVRATGQIAGKSVVERCTRRQQHVGKHEIFSPTLENLPLDAEMTES
jgi:hypothetical protein